jgi:hypothetical protein
MKRNCGLLLLSAVMWLPGCSGPPPGDVKGTVTYQGKPLRSGQVAFIPQSGVPVTADISADGTYEIHNVPPGEAFLTVVSLPPDSKGPGVQLMQYRQKHREAVKNNQPPPPPPPTEQVLLLPAKYADPQTSELRFTVESGPNTCNIDLP